MINGATMSKNYLNRVLQNKLKEIRVVKHKKLILKIKQRRVQIRDKKKSYPDPWQNNLDPGSVYKCMYKTGITY